MKIKVAELEGRALDWAVAKAEYNDRRVELHDTSPAVQVETQPGSGDRYGIGWFSFRASTDWSQGGPIIEEMLKQGLVMCAGPAADGGYSFIATLPRPSRFNFGSTPLIATMRCYVASKLGGEVDVPEELAALAQRSAEEPQQQQAHQRPRGSQ